MPVGSFAGKRVTPPQGINHRRQFGALSMHRLRCPASSGRRPRFGHAQAWPSGAIKAAAARPAATPRFPDTWQVSRAADSVPPEVGARTAAEHTVTVLRRHRRGPARIKPQAPPHLCASASRLFVSAWPGPAASCWGVARKTQAVHGYCHVTSNLLVTCAARLGPSCKVSQPLSAGHRAPGHIRDTQGNV
jgi:hypothetical protein